MASNFRKQKRKMKATRTFAIISFISTLLFSGALAQEQCGSHVGGAVCPGGLCCSKFGYCGNAPEYCDGDCQSQCTPGGGATPTPTPATPTPTPSGGGDLGSLISQAVFNDMLKHRSDSSCQGGFYTYDSFLTAAKSFGGFATTGDTDIRKREIAAFFGQTSHETTGGSPNAADGPYAWGYCFIQEQNKADYCNASAEWPCAAGKQYYGRGPIQLTWNYNYGQAGKAIGEDLISNPDLVATDPVISFKTALWYWMTAQAPKPSCHDVITGQWTPTEADTAAGRVPGYGMTTNIINGGVECANRANDKVEDRIGYYKRYCTLLSVGTGDNLDCANQTPYS